MRNASQSPETSCMDDYDPSALSVEEAARHIHAGLRPVKGFEKVALRSAIGRTLAEDVCSPLDVPSHTNSAMDGYAVNSADLPKGSEAELTVLGTSWAGKPFSGSVLPGQCVRIMTGGVLPEGTDTVIAQERVQRHGERIRFESGNRPGDNVRKAGEDLTAGSIMLSQGTRITPAELGLIASIGIAEVKVRRRLRVAILATGDELRSIGEPLAPGEIYDSNRYTLHGMLTRLGAEIIDMGVARDRREEVRDALSEAATLADVIVTSGGVSVGEADFVKDVLAEVGSVSFWKIAVKPGRPLAFGRIGGAVFFGLPGNPVSVMVTFYQFVQPALRTMMGQRDTQPKRIRVRCVSRLAKQAGRMEFQRGIVEHDGGGELIVRSTGPQGSGILNSMSQANCFIVLPTGCAGIDPGTSVEVELFDSLV